MKSKTILKDKVVVITGASRGLGKALAQVLSAKGAKLVISGRSVNDLDAVAKEVGAVPVVVDVTKESDVEHLAEVAVSEFGRIDIWINNAGLWLPKAPAEDIDMKKAHELLEVNLFGTVYGSRVAIKNMKSTKSPKNGKGSGQNSGGTIVNIVSTSALQGRPNQSVYAASKHAAKGFTDSIREELAAIGEITVIGVYPGGIKTNLFDADKPGDFADFMSPESVAQKIVGNLEADKPELEQVLRRDGQVWKAPVK